MNLPFRNFMLAGGVLVFISLAGLSQGRPALAQSDTGPFTPLGVIPVEIDTFPLTDFSPIAPGQPLTLSADTDGYAKESGELANVYLIPSNTSLRGDDVVPPPSDVGIGLYREKLAVLKIQKGSKKTDRIVNLKVPPSDAHPFLLVVLEYSVQNKRHTLTRPYRYR